MEHRVGRLYDHAAPARHHLHIEAVGLVRRLNPQAAGLHQNALPHARSIAHFEMKIFCVARDGDVVIHRHHAFHMQALVLPHLRIDTISAVGFRSCTNSRMMHSGLRLFAALFGKG